MATALTLSAANPLANPLKDPNFGVKRKPSLPPASPDGAGASYSSPPLAKHAYAIPSPVLVVKPAFPSASAPSTTAPSITAPSTITPANPSITSAKAPLKLSYAEILKSSGNLNASGNTLKSSASINTGNRPASNAPQNSSTSLEGNQRKSKLMDKKLDFETERAKLKARRLAKKGYERQTGKTWSDTNEMSQQEWEIYQAQVKKHEEALLQHKRDQEAAEMLAANIKRKEVVLATLQNDMVNKVKKIEEGKADLEQFRADFEESLKQLVPSSSDSQSHASTRMREEQEKKKLRAAWRNSTNSDDPVHRTRRSILVAQEEVATLNLQINNLKKELTKLKDVATREVSSKQIMRDEQKKREEMVRQGIQKERPAPKPKVAAAPPPLRSHQARMEEQKALKAKARASRLSASSSSSSSTGQAP